MRVIIAGSRDFGPFRPHGGDPASVAAAVRASGFVPTEVVSGGARGVDAAGEAWASLRGIPVKRFPADWRAHGKAAGPIRNQAMAAYGEALVAIWDGVSAGTANMIAEARAAGLPVYVIIDKPFWSKQEIRYEPRRVDA